MYLVLFIKVALLWYLCAMCGYSRRTFVLAAGGDELWRGKTYCCLLIRCTVNTKHSLATFHNAALLTRMWRGTIIPSVRNNKDYSAVPQLPARKPGPHE